MVARSAPHNHTMRTYPAKVAKLDHGLAVLVADHYVLQLFVATESPHASRAAKEDDESAKPPPSERDDGDDDDNDDDR
jgi:hypothetical protein